MIVKKCHHLNIYLIYMILDKYLSFNQKVKIAIIAGSIWIYFRTLDHYKLLPRNSIVSVILVSLWIYLNYYEPLFLPIGLLIMYIYSGFNKNKSNNL